MTHPRHATAIFERRSEKRLGARRSAKGCGRRCAESPFGLFRSGRIGLSASGESARPLVPRQEGSIHPPLSGQTLRRPEPGRPVRPVGPDRRRRAGGQGAPGPRRPVLDRPGPRHLPRPAGRPAALGRRLAPPPLRRLRSLRLLAPYIHAIWALATLAVERHRPDLARVLEFYDRWFPSIMRRITGITRICIPHYVTLRSLGDWAARPGYG